MRNHERRLPRETAPEPTRKTGYGSRGSGDRASTQSATVLARTPPSFPYSLIRLRPSPSTFGVPQATRQRPSLGPRDRRVARRRPPRPGYKHGRAASAGSRVTERRRLVPPPPKRCWNLVPCRPRSRRELLPMGSRTHFPAPRVRLWPHAMEQSLPRRLDRRKKKCKKAPEKILFYFIKYFQLTINNISR